MNLEDYQPASLGGVSILVPRNSGDFGRNAIEHLYPDSEQHYVEDNGRLLRKYSFPAVVHGQDVKSRFLALQNVIEKPGPTTLVHPNFGAVFVQIGDCSFDITQKDAGVVNVHINCCEAGSPSFPSLTNGTGIAIGGLTAKALIAMAGLFKSNYVTPKSPTSVEQIRAALSNVASSVETIFRSSERVIDLATSVITPANTYLPDSLGDNLTELFRAPVKDDDTDSDSLYNGWLNITKKIAPIYQPFDVTTLDLKERAIALETIQAFANSAKLIHFCEAVSHYEYTTADQAVRDRELIASTQAVIAPSVFPEVKHQVDEIITETLEYLSSLEIQLPKIEVLAAHEFPVIPLAYQLYGPNSNRVQTLIDINQDRNLMLYDGEVNILRDG